MRTQSQYVWIYLNLFTATVAVLVITVSCIVRLDNILYQKIQQSLCSDLRRSINFYDPSVFHALIYEVLRSTFHDYVDRLVKYRVSRCDIRVFSIVRIYIHTYVCHKHVKISSKSKRRSGICDRYEYLKS